MDEILVKKFIKETINPSYLDEVMDIANKLKLYLEKKHIFNQLKSLNIKNTGSIQIQNIFIDFAEELGFESEKKGLFKDYKTRALRPDYFKKLNNGGILMEVERGKTITNNMDLLDLWKCHICEEANHLFLIVPLAVSHTSNIYNYVCNRIDSFFKEKNYINVDSVIIFGY